MNEILKDLLDTARRTNGRITVPVSYAEAVAQALHEYTGAAVPVFVPGDEYEVAFKDHGLIVFMEIA